MVLSRAQFRLVLPVLLSVLVSLPVLAGFAGTDLFIPMAGRGVGAYPSNWFTTVYLYNPNATAVSVDLSFLERNKDNVATAPPRVTDTLAPGETKVYENIVETTFSKTAYGAVRIQCAQKLVGSARVFSKESESAPLTQTFGQDFAATPASFAIGLNESSDILGGYTTQPYQDSEARFNIGCVETTGLGSATVRWVARDSSGQEQKHYDRTVPRLSQTQGFFHDYFSGVELTKARVSVNVIAGSGRVICYGSLVTNDKTFPKPVQDPTTFEMTYPEGALAAGAGAGVGGSGAAGQVAFWSAEKELSGSGGLVWDSGAARLGIGTATPAQRLDVNGNIRMPATGAASGALIVGASPFLHGFGADNTFVGPGAGNFSLTGTTNTGVGSSALSQVTTGAANTGVGHRALWHTTVGYENTAVGGYALLANIDGDLNTAVGSQVLRSNTSGDANTGIGTSTLYANTTGYRNTAVGRLSMESNIGGNSHTAVGYGSLQANTGGEKNVAVGSLSMSAGSGGRYNAAVGANSLQYNTTGQNNAALGYAALNSNTEGSGNTAIGAFALNKPATSASNTAVGYRTLSGAATASNNTAVGAYALQDNGAGTYNAAFGSNAMIRNVAGSNNTAAGVNALHENLDGVHNAAFGANGLYMNTSGSNNTAAGGSSLKSNVGGARNSAFGYTALYDNVNGEQNTALGYRAGYAALGTGNVFLGANAGALETGSSRLYIANTNVATLIYGQFDTKRVAVNATDPTQTLDVNGGLRVRGLASAGVTGVAADANGVLVFSAPSDARLKRDIAPLDASVDVLAALAGLHPVSYSWDTEQERVRDYGSRREIGLLAQDVEKVVPELVSVGADGFKSVDYARLTALLVAVARAQQQELEALKAEVAALRR